MEALLLAGGFGTRLRPLTYTRPKPLLPVGGRPMLEWVLDRLPPEVDRVVVAVNWQAEVLERYFDTSDRDLEFRVVREEEPLGTAGAVKNCQEHLESARFFVLNADIVSDMDLAAMLEQHRAHGAVGTIALKEVAAQDVVHFGVAQMDDEVPDRIRGFVEKPATPEEAPSRLINAGAYLLERDVLELIPEGRLVSMEKEIFPQLLDRGFYGWSFDGLWIDVGDPARLRDATMQVGPDGAIGKDSTVASDAAVIDSVLGTGCEIGAGTRLERCVLGDRVRVAPDSVLIDCVVGDDESVSGALTGQRVWTRPVPEGYPRKQVGNVLPGKS